MTPDDQMIALMALVDRYALDMAHVFRTDNAAFRERLEEKDASREAVEAALREALTTAVSPQASQPVAWRWRASDVLPGFVISENPEAMRFATEYGRNPQPLYTAPAQASQSEARPEAEPVAYLYHDARTPKDAHPWLHSTMLVLAADRRPGLAGETPLYTTPPQASQPLTEWVAASDRLPAEEDGEVLVRMRDGRCEIAWATYWHGASNAFAQWTFRDPDEDESPTHWMHIPAIEAAHGIGAQKGQP